MEDADDVLRRLSIDGVARVRRVEDRLETLLRRQVDRQRHDLGPGHHHVRRLLVREVEDLVEHLLLLLLELALDRRALEQHLQLCLRVDGALRAGRLHPERPKCDVARALQEPDQRLEEDEERPHRRREPQRDPLRVAERHPLRHELAGDDVEEREQEQRQRDGDRRRHQGVERLGQDVLSERSDRQRGDGDAELHRGDEPRRLGGDAQYEPRAAVALLLELVHAGAANGDERVLGRDEEGVQQHESRDCDQLEEESHERAPRTGAQVLGGKSLSKEG